MNNSFFKSPWLARFTLGAAILVAFVAGYAWRGHVHENGRWLPPSQRLSAYLSLPGSSGSLLATRDTDQPTPDTEAKTNPYKLLNEVRQDIDNNFYKTNIDETELTYGAIRGMLKSLGDRFTRFMTPAAYREFQVKNNGQFVGIGARVSTVEKYTGNPADHRQPATRPIVVDAMPGSPALKAGLKKDDVVLKIDNHDTADLSLSAAVAFIRGKKGTPLTLIVERKTSPAEKNAKPTYKTLRLTIVRDVIEVHPVKLTWLPHNIAWVELKEFNKKSDEEMTKALTKVQHGDKDHGPAKGLVLDMRNNPGGLLDSVVAIASRFISKGAIVYTHERTGEMREMDAKTSRYLNLKIPIVVLVNNYSASAAEILTGALKDNHLATVVGEHTYGKASVQVLLNLSDGGALAITTAHYLTPAKHNINNVGIEPNIKVAASAADKDTGRGAQLHKAMAIVQSAVGN